MNITDYLSKNTVKVSLESVNKKDAMAELIDLLQKDGKITDSAQALEVLMEREALGTTGIGQGIAIPHAKIDSLGDVCAALGISKKGINFDSLDGEPVYIVFMFLAPSSSSGKHLKLLAKASQLLKDKYFREPLKEMTSVDEIINTIKQEEE